MRTSRTLLPAVALTLLAPLAPAYAADVPSRRIDPSALQEGEPLRLPYLDQRRQVIVDGDERTRLSGDTVGSVKAVHRNGDDGWVAYSSTLNHNSVYRVDPDGSTHELIGDRENVTVLVDEGRVAQEFYPNDSAGIVVAVYDVAGGDRIGRLTASWIDVHDYRDGLVWLTMRQDQQSAQKLVTWDPDTGEVVDQGLRSIDGVDLDRGAAWRWSDRDLTRLRVIPLVDDAGWDAWSSEGFVGVAPAFSPDGDLVVTYTRRKIGRDTAAYPGSMVLRDADTGDAVRRFAGRPTGDVTAWESDRRFVSWFWDTDSTQERMAQVRLGTDGSARRVSPFYGWRGGRSYVG